MKFICLETNNECLIALTQRLCSNLNNPFHKSAIHRLCRVKSLGYIKAKANRSLSLFCINALTYKLASGLLPCQFKLQMFVFQFQLVMRGTKADRVESGRLSCNQTEISNFSGATIRKRLEKKASTAAACALTFDLGYKVVVGGCHFRSLAWT